MRRKAASDNKKKGASSKGSRASSRRKKPRKVAAVSKRGSGRPRADKKQQAARKRADPAARPQGRPAGRTRDATGAQKARKTVPGKKAPETGKGRKGVEEGRGRFSLPGLITHMSARSAILILLLVVFVAFSIGPVSRNLEATSRLKQKEKELAEQERATRALEEEVAEARSMEYVEDEARKQRMVAPGEVLYLVTTEEEEEVEYKVKSLQSMDEAWENVRQMLNCAHRRDGSSTEDTGE